MSQARLPRTEPSTELITAHKVNTATLMPPVQTRDFSALPKHREPETTLTKSELGCGANGIACQDASRRSD